MKELTNRQTEVLNFIRNFIMKNYYPPTLKEISEAFNITIPGAHQHVKALEKKGKLEYVGKHSRAISIVGEKQNYSEIINIPILGNIAAGQPIFADENYQGSINVSSSHLGKGEFFALRVFGTSMKDVGIIEDDIAIIKQQNTAENGEIIAALLNEETCTLKRFYKETNRIRLEAENPEFSPLYSRNVRILGKLKCIVRDYD